MGRCLDARCCPPGRRAGSERAGFAMLTVLLVLMSLLVLCTPFLWTAGNADRTSAELVAEVRAELAVDSALRHARHELGRSHEALDRTRFSDGLEELSPRPESVEVRPPHDDATGAMWSYEVRDHAGLIDFDSASPQVLANLLGQATYLTARLPATATEAEVARVDGFLDRGVVAIGPEYIVYTSLEDDELQGLERGFLADETTDCPPSAGDFHPIGAPVIGLDALSMAYWRLARGLAPNAGGSIAALAEELGPLLTASLPNLSDALFDDPDSSARQELERAFARRLVEAFEPALTLDGGTAAGDRWQHATTLLSEWGGEGGECRFRPASTRWFAPGSTVRISEGESVAYGLVLAVSGNTVQLRDPISQEFTPGVARIETLARRPVNVNTAPPVVLQALFENLKLAGRNHRISRDEARDLAARVIELRPFDGFRDFIERFVLPAAGLVPLGELEGLGRAKDDDERRRILAEALARRDAQAELEPELIDADDAQALVINALNPNDSALEFSTMPLTFVSRGLHEIQARAVINAPSGRQLAALERRQLEWVVPQLQLLKLWTYQEDFEEALRHTRAAPGWGSGPIATTVADPGRGADPPPRAASYFQRLPIDQLAGQEERGALGGFEAAGGQFPSRDVDGFITPWHVRVNESGPRAGKMEHFDRPRSALEGRRLSVAPFDVALERFELVGNSNQIGPQGTPLELLRPFSMAMWVRPEASLAGTHLVDLGGTSPDGDRVELFVDPESDELVLRVTDGPGDHPDTTGFVERSEVRYAALEGGALPVDVWTHVEIDVRGTRPDQIGLRIDGYPAGRRPGLTRLSSSLAAGDRLIQVESTEGFPDRGPIQIGDEVIEVAVTGPTTFEALYQDSGASAGFGGRMARQVVDVNDLGGGSFTKVPAGLGLVDTDHPSGSTVTIYGYSTPLVSPVPSGAATLSDGIGPFAVARVTSVVGSLPPQGDPFNVELDAFQPGGGVIPIQLQIGRGFDTASGEVEALELAPVDAAQTQEELMSAFSPDGGYAALIQLRPGVLTSSGNVQAEEDLQQWTAPDTGSLMAGLEIVAYSGRQGNQLRIFRFGVNSNELTMLGTKNSGVLGQIGKPGESNHVFLLEWEWSGTFPGGFIGPEAPVPGDDDLQLGEYDSALEASVFVVPISIALDGSPTSFLPPGPGRSEFAQIVRTGSERGRTEWVRYDELVQLAGRLQLVRDDPDALGQLFQVLTKQQQPNPIRLELLGDDEGGGPGGMPVAGAATAPPAPSAAQTSTYWSNAIGVTEYAQTALDLPVSDAARTWFQFRGVLGTQSFAHPGLTTVTPVFRVFDRRVPDPTDPSLEPVGALQPGWGWPGGDDPVFVVDESVTDIGLPNVVHRAIRPPRRLVRANWERPADMIANPYQGLDAPDSLWFETDYERLHHLVALRESYLGIAIPSQPFTLVQDGSAPFQQYEAWGQQPDIEMRQTTRLVKYPSGELPRVVTGARLGKDVVGAEASAPAVVDEFFSDRSRAADQDLGGTSLVLAADVDSTDPSFSIALDRLRTPFGDVPHDPTAALPSSWLPPSGGLLRIGDELIAYHTADGNNGTVLVAPGGRGFLQSEAQPHRAGEAVTLLGHLAVSHLQQAVGPDASALPIAPVPGFGASGTVRVGNELVHYTNRVDGLSMPIHDESGEDGGGARGRGLYRGRFGTAPEAHEVLTPVIEWPARYWDRYAYRADAPEQHFFEFELSQPDAWASALAVEHTDPAYPGARLGILLRTDPRTPWTSDPDTTEGLSLHWMDRLAGRPVRVDRQSSEVEARLFVEYQPGSFDPLGPYLHGWKLAPTVEQLAFDYIAPGRVLARGDR